MITIPDWSLPRPIAALGRRLPQRPPSFVLASALNAANPSAMFGPAERQALEGRVVRIRVTDAGICASIVFRDGRFRTASEHEPAVLEFVAEAAAYLQMLARQEDPDTLFFHRRLVIEGDTELGLMVKNLLDRIELPAWLREKLQAPA